MLSKNNRQYQKAFTLIELLVAIAIVGILAGLAVVSMSGATDAARMAKGKTFSESMKRSMFSSLVSEWNINEGLGNTIKDTIGSSDGDLTGHSPIWKSGSDCVMDGCLDFDDASAQYVEIPNSSSLQFTDQFSIEAWVKSDDDMPYSLISKGTYFGLYQGWHISTAGSPTDLLFEVSDGLDRKWIDFYIGRKFGWTHIVAVRDGSRILAYADGVLKSTQTNSIGSVVNGTNIFFGRRASSAGSYFDGRIDQVRFYNQPLLLSQIRRDYLAGLDRLLASGQMAEKDYQEKLNKFKYAAAEN
jgi:prepilin-type N-terminal cleavage/methylation domain-containing protein